MRRGRYTRIHQPKINHGKFLIFFSFSESGPSANGIGSVLSQIVLCKSMKPDFNAEEKVSIEKDTRELRQIIGEMAECLPQEDPEKGE